MTQLAATAKGSATRDAIIDRAHEIARCAGLEGLSIGPLAQSVGMSKSGVFAHFGSREDLQLAVLEEAARRFGDSVLVPALSKPRGLPRLRAVMRHWFEWVRGNSAGGCVLLASVAEYDDRPGPLRDMVVANEQRWRDALRRTVEQAIECGDLRAGDFHVALDLVTCVVGAQMQARRLHALADDQAASVGFTRGHRGVDASGA